jgi:soluble lytic murein transglycosylase-like protein
MITKHVIYLCIALIFMGFVPFSTAEEFYSYLDDNGTQVFTNIPPVNRNLPPDRISPREVINEKTSLALNDIPESEPLSFDSIIDKYARHYELDPSLIHSIIATESGFNSNAVSSKGACGLMQLMPATADRLGVKDSFDPEQNIRAGVRHFRSLMDMFNNNLALSLAAYNAGENLVRRLGRIPEIQETIDYVRSVTRRYIEKQKSDRKNDQALNIKESAPTFRFVDSSGVLHLTNIPPNR